MFYDIYVELCKQRGMSPSAAADAIGINRATVTNWKKNGSTPSGEVLNKVSGFFGVSVDYLLTGKYPGEAGSGYFHSDDPEWFRLHGLDPKLADNNKSPYTNEYGVEVIPADPAKAAEDEAERARMRDENRENMRQMLNAMAQQKSPQPETEGGLRDSSLDSIEAAHLIKYRSLDDHGRETVDYITERELERCKSSQPLLFAAYGNKPPSEYTEEELKDVEDFLKLKRTRPPKDE